VPIESIIDTLPLSSCETEAARTGPSFKFSGGLFDFPDCEEKDVLVALLDEVLTTLSLPLSSSETSIDRAI
jgi:hypothetical protein